MEEKNKNLFHEIADSLRWRRFCFKKRFNNNSMLKERHVDKKEGLIKHGEKHKITWETIKVAAHPPIIIEAAMPAKCPTTVPTNMKIEIQELFEKRETTFMYNNVNIPLQ